MRNQGLEHILRKDLDGAIELPPREEWRPSRARVSWRPGWQLALVAVGGILLLALVITAQLGVREQQRQVPAAPPSVAPTALVNLTIKSATTGLPIYGAVVNVYYDEACCHFVPRKGLDREPIWWSRELQMSDDAGTYRMVLANFRYKLYVWVPLSVRGGDGRPNTVAYAPQWWGGSDFQNARVLEVAGTDIGIDVTLSPGHAISGVVTNRRGTRIGAVIDVYAGGTAPCCSWVDTAAAFITNEDANCQRFAPQPGGSCVDRTGEYRIAVANGIYRVRVQSPSMGPLDEFVFKWWQEAADFGGATDIVVQDADVTGIDMVLPLN